MKRGRVCVRLQEGLDEEDEEDDGHDHEGG
jgi:hypothetical protein